MSPWPSPGAEEQPLLINISRHSIDEMKSRPKAPRCTWGCPQSACGCWHDANPPEARSMTAATADSATLAAGPRVKPAAHWHDRLAQGLLLLVCAILVVFLLAPLFMILVKSVQDKDGAFVGLQQFIDYFQTPALRQSILHTLSIALAVTGITIPLAFTFAYALTRSCMPFKGTFRVIALTPILAPSLLAAISFIQWFGTQGLLKGLLGGRQDLRSDRHHPELDLRGVSARADDRPHGAAARRRKTVRSGGIAGNADAAPLLHHHAARREIRPDQRRDGGLFLYGQRLRRSPRSSAATSTCWRWIFSSRSSASRISTRARSSA